MAINFDPIVEKLESMQHDTQALHLLSNLMINSEDFAEIQQECPHFALQMHKLREEIRSIMKQF